MNYTGFGGACHHGFIGNFSADTTQSSIFTNFDYGSDKTNDPTHHTK